MSTYSETLTAFRLKAPPSTNFDWLIKSGLPGLPDYSVELFRDMKKAELAEQVRRLIAYVAQEGNLKDLELWVKGLDDKKLIAFAEANQGSLPIELSVLFLEDEREKIRDTVISNNSSADLNLDQWVKESRKGLKLSKKQVIGQGREAVVEILVDAHREGRKLTDDEIRVIKNMAMNIPDEKVIENILIFAEEDRKIAIELSCNSALAQNHVNRLVTIALGKVAEDAKWINVILELMAHQHFKLGKNSKFDDAVVEKLLNSSEVPSFIKKEFSNDAKSVGKIKRKRKPSVQRKSIRRKLAKASGYAKKVSQWKEIERFNEECA